MSVQKHEFEDSREQSVAVTVSGLYGSGSAVAGEDLMKRPRKWMARFTRPGMEGQINVELYTDDMGVEELREVFGAGTGVDPRRLDQLSGRSNPAVSANEVLEAAPAVSRQSGSAM